MSAQIVDETKATQPEQDNLSLVDLLDSFKQITEQENDTAFPKPRAVVEEFSSQGKSKLTAKEACKSAILSIKHVDLSDIEFASRLRVLEDDAKYSEPNEMSDLFKAWREGVTSVHSAKRPQESEFPNLVLWRYQPVGKCKMSEETESRTNRAPYITLVYTPTDKPHVYMTRVWGGARSNNAMGFTLEEIPNGSTVILSNMGHDGHPLISADEFEDFIFLSWLNSSMRGQERRRPLEDCGVTYVTPDYIVLSTSLGTPIPWDKMLPKLREGATLMTSAEFLERSDLDEFLTPEMKHQFQSVLTKPPPSSGYYFTPDCKPLLHGSAL